MANNGIPSLLKGGDFKQHSQFVNRPLEAIFQTKLYLPGTTHRGYPAKIYGFGIGTRVVPIGMIKGVVCLRPELDPMPLGNEKRLVQSQSIILLARTDEDASSRIPKGVKRRDEEHRRVEKLVARGIGNVRVLTSIIRTLIG